MASGFTLSYPFEIDNITITMNIKGQLQAQVSATTADVSIPLEVVSGKYTLLYDNATLNLNSGNQLVLNLANANTFTATQTFADIIATGATMTAGITDSTTIAGTDITASGTLGITGATTTAGISDSVSITTPILNSSAVQTTITGTTAGSIVISMPEQGASYKKVIAYLSGYENDTTTAQTYTYPTAFTNTPLIISNSSSITGTTTSTTALTIDPDSTTIFTGWLIIEGY